LTILSRNVTWVQGIVAKEENKRLHEHPYCKRRAATMAAFQHQLPANLSASAVTQRQRFAQNVERFRLRIWLKR